MGTPQFSVPVLERLISAGHDVCAVYCQPPRKSGRGLKLTSCPVQKCAEQHHIDVFTPTSFKQPDEQKRFASFKTDAAIVVAYGMILPQPILDTPKHGCFNIHASLLPRWRGAAPIQRAIMAGDKQTGITIIQMEAGLDTGPMCLIEKIDINEMTTAKKLHDDLSVMGTNLIQKTLEQLETGTIKFTPQPEHGVTYAKKIDKAEAKIDFSKPAKQVLGHIHGLSPFPGSWLELPTNDKPLRIKLVTAQAVSGKGKPGQVLDDQFSICCGEGAIRPVQLQRQGKGVMELSQFLRGGEVKPGTIL